MAKALSEVMAKLEAEGNLHARNTYGRHGATGPMFGVRTSKLSRMARDYGPDQELADALWATGNVDARLLAAKVADHEAITAARLEAWVEDCDWYMLVDGFVADCAARTRHVRALAEQWRGSEAEYRGRAGWSLVAHLARQGEVGGALFETCLDEIAAGIHAAANRKREAMNAALIAIGGHRAGLRERAVAVAEAVGAVEVDHGETGMVTPDARAYLEQMARYANRRSGDGGAAR
ncbi:hypothetical protein PPSIR1_36472 [Plesiocystis pacifica SIR-1]|uniref:DNA alkylation repair enzyme n=1 Tax=Plesiocystis pacifica SIR-1 TaxID=391625 RepID=A6G1J9_9BACT|nr:DNA alkylation repair protein [Plesiocystis pacifica]EDM80263.1 hypothetical protein PPSIR1_36472 [Plesiocystis pacifica SIR-1]